MRSTRREFLRSVAAWSCLALTGWANPLGTRASRAVRSAIAFLKDRIYRDGAWRSEKYAAFADGDALTPVVLWALQPAVPLVAEAKELIELGMYCLIRLTDSHALSDEPWVQLRYPLFTASYCAQVFAVAGDPKRAAIWADIVERLRISETLGWPSGCAALGAWSDSAIPPRLPAGIDSIPDMLAPNVSATRLGVATLIAAGRADRAVAANPFLERCQNYATQDPEPYDDGGFFFAENDPIRNKAGVAGRDRHDRTRFRSYGSATCDGFLALQQCGLTMDHPRMTAAASWIRRHGAGSMHSGDWADGRGSARESLHFYHAQSFAEALALIGEETGWVVEQRQLLTDEIIGQQRSDGSWQGSIPDSCEDDPLLATAFAIRALAVR